MKHIFVGLSVPLFACSSTISPVILPDPAPIALVSSVSSVNKPLLPAPPLSTEPPPRTFARANLVTSDVVGVLQSRFVETSHHGCSRSWSNRSDSMSVRLNTTSSLASTLELEWENYHVSGSQPMVRHSGGPAPYVDRRTEKSLCKYAGKATQDRSHVSYLMHLDKKSSTPSCANEVTFTCYRSEETFLEFNPKAKGKEFEEKVERVVRCESSVSTPSFARETQGNTIPLVFGRGLTIEKNGRSYASITVRKNTY